MTSVNTAIIPVAGLGTRFLPVTSSIPKVMLPIIELPALHLIIQEIVDSGIQKLVLVIGNDADTIKQYFNPTESLKKILKSQNKEYLIDKIFELNQKIEIRYVTQKHPRGLGHAILQAKNLTQNEPVAVLLPDDIISTTDEPITKLMINEFHRIQQSVIAIREVPDDLISSLGIIRHNSKDFHEKLFEITELIEKPSIKDAPSNLAVTGRYIIKPEIFEILENTQPGALQEIQLTDALSSLLQHQKIYGYKFPGEHFDIGTPLGLIKANIFYASQKSEFKKELMNWLKNQNSIY